MSNILKRSTSFVLTLAMIFSVSTGVFATKAGAAAADSALASVTESYVDAANGKNITQDVVYSVPHEERTPQAISNYTYVDYTESVERVYSHKDVNYIYGYPDRAVRPAKNMTRGEAAAVFYRLYDGVYPDMPYRMSNQTFSDLKADKWCYREIETLYNVGVIRDERGDQRFRTDEAITRAEFATWAARWANLPFSTGLTFSDVAPGHWAYGDINAASAAGWIDGYPDGTFRPDKFISRVEVMKLVNGVVNRSITMEKLNELGVRNPYIDLAASHWGYTEIMEATVQHNGADWHGTNYNDGKFNVIVEKFVDGEGKEIAPSVTSNGPAQNTTKAVPGYEYIGYIRHITYVYNNGSAAPYITKTANVTESYVGGEIEYNVTIGNKTSNAVWQNVVMTDDLPDGLELVDGSVYVDKVQTEYKLDNGVLSVNVGNIPAGKEVTVTFKAVVLPGMEGKTIVNTVVARGDNGTVKDDTCTATDKGVLINQGIIKPSVEKKASAKTAKVGDRLSYIITASNAVDATYKITNAVITDVIPKGLVFRDGSVMLNGTSTVYSYNEETRQLSVNMGDIAPGKSATVTFTVDVGKAVYGKRLYNVAVLGGSNIADVTDKDDGVLIEEGITRPVIEKTADKTKVKVGEKVTYTMTVGNEEGAQTAITNAVLTDKIPEGLEFDRGSVFVNGAPTTKYTFQDDVLKVKLGKIAPGKTMEVSFDVTVAANTYGKTIKNVASLSGDNTPEISDSDKGILVESGSTKPTLTKKANKKQADVGDSITYTLTAGNESDASVAIKNAVITDTLPKGLDFKYGSVQVNGKSVTGVSYDEASRLLTVPVGNIAPGKMVTVTFVADITKAAYGKVIKNVAVLGGDNSSDVTDKDDGVNVGDGTAKPYIIKTANKKQAKPGARVEYTLTVGNGETATVALENPVITDVIPAGLNFIDGSVYVNGKSYSNYSYDSTDKLLTINLSSIAPDTEVAVKFSVKVNEEAYNTTIENLATLSSDNGDKKQDTDDGIVIPDGRAQLEISKKADNRSPEVGEYIVYTVEVGNTAGAPVPARNVQVSDVIPEGLTFAGIVQIDGYSASYSYDNATRTLTIPVGDIAAGYTRKITVEFVVNEDAYGQTITNTAVASADNAGDKDATDAGMNIPEGKPDGYTASKTVNKNTAKVGDTLTYSFQLHNGAGATAAWKNARITDVIPKGLSFAGNVKMNGTATNNFSWDADTRTIVMTAPSIGIGESVTFSFDVKVNKNAQGQYIVNTAIVDGPGDQPDIDISDPGTMVDPGVVKPYAHKTANKSVAKVGETVMYTVEVGNKKNATAPWKNVVMKDTLPVGVQLLNTVTADGEPAAFSVNDGVLTAKLGRIGIGETVMVRYEVLVLPEAAGTTLRNMVVLSGKDGDTSTSVETPVEVPGKDEGSDPDDFYVNKDVNKTLAKVGAGTTAEDSQVTYTVTVVNDSASKKTWEDVVFTDVVDTKLATLISDTIYVDGVRLKPNQWVFQNQTLTIELGDIPYGKEIEVKFDLRFKTDAGDKTYINKAVATGVAGGEKIWRDDNAPAVQIKPVQNVSQVHYAIFHGTGHTDGSPTGLWKPARNVYLHEIAIAGYRVMTNDGQNSLQNGGAGYVPDYVTDHYDPAAGYMVAAGILLADEFNVSGMTEGEDYIAMGDESDPTYAIYATKNQIGRVLEMLFGDDYGVAGNGRMTRLELAQVFCQIQKRDTTPNYQEAQAAGLKVDTFTDCKDNGVVIETSNTHDYVLDSYGNETWVLNDLMTK